MVERNSHNSVTRASALALVAVVVMLFSVLPAQVRGGSLAASASPAAGELEWTAVLDKPEVAWFRIDFPTRDVGYVAGGPDWGETSQVYVAKTTNGGLNWGEPTPVPDAVGTTLGLACKDADTCWIVGYSNPKIRRTTDGGATWQYGWDDYGYRQMLYSAGWTGNGTTILAGTTGWWEGEGYEANMLRATNGINFKAVTTDRAPVVVWDFSCPAPGTCYSAAKGRAHYSTNDGQSWTTRIIPAEMSEQFYGIDCVNTTTCWMVGKQKRIIYTSNTGTTWQAANTNGVAVGSGSFLWDVDMIDAQNGYTAGCANTNANDVCTAGLVARTTDGVNWESIPSPTGTEILDLHVVSMDEVFLVDASGKVWRGAAQPTPTPTATLTPTPTATPTATPSPTPSTAVVGGSVFDDLNQDGLLNENEPGLPGAELVLMQGPVERYKTTSGSDGVFQFVDVQPGQYTFSEKAAPPSVRSKAAETDPSSYAMADTMVTFLIEAGERLTFFVPQRVTVPPTPTPTPVTSCYCGYLPMILSQESGSTP